jgi:hypothetical protein
MSTSLTVHTFPASFSEFFDRSVFLNSPKIIVDSSRFALSGNASASSLFYPTVANLTSPFAHSSIRISVALKGTELSQSRSVQRSALFSLSSAFSERADQGADTRSQTMSAGTMWLVFLGSACVPIENLHQALDKRNKSSERHKPLQYNTISDVYTHPIITELRFYLRRKLWIRTQFNLITFIYPKSVAAKTCNASFGEKACKFILRSRFAATSGISICDMFNSHRKCSIPDP